MKRTITVLLAVICMCALAAGGLSAFAAAETGNYASLFGKAVSAGNVADLTVSGNDEAITDGVTIPAGSVKLVCDATTTGNTNIFCTTSKAVNLEKTVYLKWRENFAGDMAQYWIGLGTEETMKGDPATAEFAFCQDWGSIANNAGTMKSAFYSKKTAVGAWDLGTGAHPLSRGPWYFYQLKIAYNAAAGAYDVTLSFEGHDGSDRTELATYSVEMDVIKSGAYLFFGGSSHPSAAPSIYLINDSRDSHLAGTNFADWYHKETVSTLAEFEAALADTSVNAIDCVISDSFKVISGDRVIERSLTITSVDKAGNWQMGTAGLTFEDSLTVRGAGVDFTLNCGAGNFVVDGAKALFSIVSMGYNKTGLDTGKPDHCIVVKNGGEATASWSSLDISAKGAVRLENGSKFIVPANDNATSIYKLTSQVAVDIYYNGIVPTIFCDNKNVASVYAVMIGEGNQLVGFDGLTPALVSYETENDGTFLIQYVPIEDFTFDKTAVEVAAGGSVSGYLTATEPEAPTNLTAFSYAIEDGEIAEVAPINQGLGFKVTGKKAGETNLVIRTTDRLNPGEAVVKVIPVTVSAPTINGFEADHSGVTKELSQGTALDLSALVVSATLTDGSKQVLSASDYTVDLGGFDQNKAGTYTITVHYGDYPAQTFAVTVTEASAGGCNSAVGAGTALGLLLMLAGIAAVKRKEQ